jgi:hypothetical protein
MQATREDIIDAESAIEKPIKLSSLKADIAKRKLNKAIKHQNRMVGKPRKVIVRKTNKTVWGEVHELVGLLRENLKTYANIGLLAANAFSIIPLEHQNIFKRNLDMLGNDIAKFVDTLNGILQKTKLPEEEVTENDITVFLSIYEQLEEIRCDIGNTVAVSASNLTDILDGLDEPSINTIKSESNDD